MDRRRFLFGLGGAVVALPFLEGLSARKSRAGDPPLHKFAIFVRQANGVQQKENTEPDRFWPSALGPITTASLTADSDRAVAELKDYGPKLTMVRGVKFAFPGNGCGHSGGGNQCLTAAKVSADPSDNKSLAMGESIDNRIARELNSGTNKEPLTLYAGRMAGYIDEVLSYRGPLQLRAAERNPYTAYKKMFNIADPDTIALEHKAAGRKSVNDLVRAQMTALLKRPDLSTADKARLDLHFSSIRDLEIKASLRLPDARIKEMEAMSPKVADPANIEEISRMQCDIIALAMAAGITHAATLQIGDGNDSTEYVIGGVKQPRYHQISHRIYSDGATGDPIPDATLKHHEIDKIHQRIFKYLLDRLSSYTGPLGTLLDQGVAVMTNDLGTGVGHSYNNIPYVCAGSIGGFLKTGQFIDAGGVTNNQILNTFAAGVGVKNGAGDLLDDFGDPSLKKGLITAMRA
jgi:hypothetical protein